MNRQHLMPFLTVLLWLSHTDAFLSRENSVLFQRTCASLPSLPLRSDSPPVLQLLTDDSDWEEEESVLQRSAAGVGVLVYALSIWGLIIFLLYDLVLAHFPTHLYLRVY